MAEFPEGGVLGSMIRSMDWSATAVGDVSRWDHSLRTAVAIMLNSPLPSYVVWSKEYTQFYNDLYIPIIGESNHPDALGRSAKETWQDHWELFGAMLDRVMATGKTCAYDDYPGRSEGDGAFRQRFFSFSCVPIPNDRGEPGGVFVTCVETTERILHEHRSNQERARMHEIFLQAPVGICVHEGPQHVYVLCNDAFYSIVGGKRDVLGKPVRDAFPEVRNLGYFELLDGVFTTGKPFVGREAPTVIELPDGTSKAGFVDFVMQPRVDGQGRVHGVITVCTDVTLQVEARESVEGLAAQLKDAVASRDEFLSIASHELNTPITVLKLQLQRLLRMVDGVSGLQERRDRLQRSLDMSHRQVNRLIELVTDLLDVARIQAGRMEYRLVPTNLLELVREVAENHQEQLAGTGNRLEIDVDGALVGLWDRSRIEQVLTNLLSNACKYAPSTLVRVAACRLGSQAKIVVQDFGPGIPKDRQARIFNRFERATPSRNISGLGLGLFIVASIVQGHGGSVELVSDAHGTCFTLLIPLAATAASARYA